MRRRISAVVPTLGRTDLLGRCLEALRRDGGAELEIVLIDQSPAGIPLPGGLVDQTLRPGRNLGFTGAVNLGIGAATSTYVAVVNDDAIIEPGWFALLLGALERDAGLAAAQGTTLTLSEPVRIDGLGIAWNRWWQAIQVDHGKAPWARSAASWQEVFGASATAVIFRRSALDEVAPDGAVFDPELETYYEDVDLAARLRAAGHRAVVVFDAVAHHAGSTTSATMGSRRWRLIYGNRYLIVARVLGSRFWPSLPRLALRDVVDFLHALGRGQIFLAAGIPLGWLRAALHLGRFARRGPPLSRLVEPARPRLAADPAQSIDPSIPLLSGVVVEWQTAPALNELLAAWPRDDPRFELVVVDNGSSPPLETRRDEITRGGAVRLLSPGRNLGFAGGANAGFALARAPLLLLLNPDAAPEPGALDALLEGFATHPEAAGLAPALHGPDGAAQASWQLRRLPSAWALVFQPLPFPGRRGDATMALAAGSAVEQPAAAALALRRSALVDVGGFDDRFRPAWFEDVDLARRLRSRGEALLYWPAARFRHGLGSTVPVLGYGTFLWLYHRNLALYLRLHHGYFWSGAVRVTCALGALIRLPLVLMIRPRRAASRGAAVRGLCVLLAGAFSGWRWPRRLALMARDAADEAAP